MFWCNIFDLGIMWIKGLIVAEFHEYWKVTDMRVQCYALMLYPADISWSLIFAFSKRKNMLTKSVLHSLFRSDDSETSCMANSILWEDIKSINNVHQVQS